MTDNRTTELLPCPFCGSKNVETSYKDTFSGDFRRGVYCADCCGGIYPYYDTEAEAIAAWNTRADYHGYEQAAIEAWKSIKTWNTRTHGTLTAEQVEKATYAHSIHADCADADWQAIADELNARAERTCRIESSYLNDFTSNHECWYEFEMECGYRFTWDEMEPPNCCPNCGGEVREKAGNE